MVGVVVVVVVVILSCWRTKIPYQHEIDYTVVVYCCFCTPMEVTVNVVVAVAVAVDYNVIIADFVTVDVDSPYCGSFDLLA